MRDALGGSEKKREEGSLREDGEGVRSTGNLPPHHTLLEFLPRSGTRSESSLDPWHYSDQINQKQNTASDPDG